MNFPYDDLQSLLSETRHRQSEPSRSGVVSAWRRHQDTHLESLRERFETLAERWLDDDERRAWLQALHHDAPTPEVPQTELPPVFKGRTESGALVLVRPRSGDPNADFELVIDGDVVERMPGPITGLQGTRWQMAQNEAVEETFECPDEALDALEDFRNQTGGSPPWQWAQTLRREGLIDRNFSMTARGRRLLDQLRRAA